MNETKLYGYSGIVLKIDLSQKTIQEEKIEERFCRRYLGGAGFVSYYLWKEMEEGIDALAPENIIVFSLGPASGLKLPGAARHCVGAKSPMTDGIAKSESGGSWMTELKRAGYDAIIITGKSVDPVYLWIHDDEAEIKDAGHLWGMETKETQKRIREELDDKRAQIAMIGPGGENMVRYACINHGLYDVAGRGGLGAVMGSKNLKAVAVRGHAWPALADEIQFKSIRDQMVSQKFPMSEYGTGGPEMSLLESLGNLPVRNFRDGLFPEVENIHGGVIADTIRIKMDGCYACPIKCKKAVKVDSPYTVDPDYGGPEYETLASLGSNCGVGDLKAIVKGNERCNAYSLDTISTGATIGFAMECYEKGFISREDTGGIDLRFGNAEAMLESIELIAKYSGFGKVLAQGTARMAKDLGVDTYPFAMQVKGLEPGMHDPRLSGNMGLGFMTCPQGADHGVVFPEAFFSWENMKAELQPLGFEELPPTGGMGPRNTTLFRLLHLKQVVQDCIPLCIFLRYNLMKQSEILNAITGWDTNVMELVRIGERVATLQRLFNVREGFTDKDDVLPERFYQPKTDGALSEKYLDKEKYEDAKRYFYRLMGWDQKGVPLEETVEALYID